MKTETIDLSQPFVYNDDIFCNDGIDDLLEHLSLDYNEDLSDLPDDWATRVELTRLEPMIQFSKDWILQNIDDERIDEDGNSLDKFAKILDRHKNALDLIASEVPKLYYGINKYVTITKRDLLEHLKWKP